MDPDLILRHLRRHIALDPAETDFILSLLQPRKLKRKSFLLRAGDVCTTENFILKGCLRTYTVDENGFEHILFFGVEDWWVGDLYSFLSQKPTRFYIEALEDSEILQIAKPDLDRLYERVPKFERFFRILLQNAFIAQQQRIHQNLSLSAEQRYREFCTQYPKLEQRISQKHISAYLGITPVFLSMLRKKQMQGRFNKLL